ncbi:immunoglobulin domain-containing protein, partial [Aquabacterium sp.]|uniref:immunoglobulin domain-containing protein n=1 Tax=Aquabacterium sp. TaxID=1872578 RepID=UPI0025C4F59B
MVTNGQPATFSVAATGTTTVQWQRQINGTWVDIPGATGFSYTLANAQASDDTASFRATLTPSDGGPVLTSSPVTLRVLAQAVAPSVVVNPVDLILTAGQSGTFSVTATGTSLSYRWQRRGGSETSFTDIPDAAGSTLILSTSNDGDNGTLFRVVISNALGSVTSMNARLNVTHPLSAPVFTAIPSNVTVVSGQTASFSVTLTGEPAPTLTWQRSADGTIWTNIDGETSSTMTIPATTAAHNGQQYRAVASNTSGKVVSPPGILTVNAAPVMPFLVTQPANVSVGAGSAARFAVVVGGTPAPTLQWQVSLDAGATFANITGAVAQELTLPSSTLADNGKKLRVLVLNSAGTAISNIATLTVRPGPQITRQPQPQAWRVGLPLPMFSVGAAGSDLSYQWQTSASQGAGFQDIPAATASTLTTFTPPTQDTWVRVIVKNAAGDATTSEATRLTRLKWTYQSPLPTGDSMRALKWVTDTNLVAVGQSGTVI